jgi:hypothetical protein
MRAKKIIVPLLIVLLLLAALSLLLVNECFYWAGMGAAYKSCDCVGIERELYDQTAADGPRKTVCIGIVQSTQCYQYMGGPGIGCKAQ